MISRGPDYLGRRISIINNNEGSRSLWRGYGRRCCCTRSWAVNLLRGRLLVRFCNRSRNLRGINTWLCLLVFVRLSRWRIPRRSWVTRRGRITWICKVRRRIGHSFDKLLRRQRLLGRNRGLRMKGSILKIGGCLIRHSRLRCLNRRVNRTRRA